MMMFEEVAGDVLRQVSVGEGSGTATASAGARQWFTVRCRTRLYQIAESSEG